MAVAKMKKLTIVGHRSAMDGVVALLHDMGCVQIVDVRDGLTAADAGADAAKRAAKRAADDLAARLSRVDYCINYLAKFDTRQKGLIESFIGQKENVPAAVFEKVAAEFDETPVYEACVRDEQASSEARTERSRLENLLLLVEPWADMDVPVEILGERDDLCVVAASCPAPEFEALRREMEDAPAHLEPVSETGGVVRFVAFYLPGDQAVAAALASHAVSRVSFGDAKGTPAAILEDARRRLADLDAVEREIRDRAQELLETRVNLWILHDCLEESRAREQAKENLAETRAAFVLEGWVKQRDLEQVEKRVRAFSESIEVMAGDPGPEDNVPVSLENHPLIEPFEVVTNIYGFPRYGEQDPTPLLAPFFFVFFGLALTDAAYGIVLALACWYLMTKYRVPRSGRKFFMLLIYGGISTTVFGAMAGGWFGNLIDFMPKGLTFLRTFRQMFFVFDPMVEPLRFMVISLALGVVQVWLGVLVKMVATVRSGAWLDAVYDQGTWLFFLPSLVMMAVTGAGVASHLSGVASRCALAGAVAIIITQGRNTRNVFLKPFAGMYQLYSTVNYFSDVLSYTRLLALGLATGVIANVINQIADLAKMIPLVGWIITLVILVGGHAFNLIINVLGAFIHSGRLQFVEFFTKFFEGGGKGFRPFRKEAKYVTVER